MNRIKIANTQKYLLIGVVVEYFSTPTQSYTETNSNNKAIKLTQIMSSYIRMVGA